MPGHIIDIHLVNSDSISSSIGILFPSAKSKLKTHVCSKVVVFELGSKRSKGTLESQMTRGIFWANLT